MLQQFTWQDFLIAAFILTLIWYAGVILIFYRKEMKAFLNRGRSDKPVAAALPHRWQKGVEELKQDESEDLMGKPKMPEGMESIAMSGFGFTTGQDKEAQVGLVPDVLQEIKGVFQAIAQQDGKKQDFFRLMAAVSGNYPQLSSNPNIGRIQEFISENAPFHLSPEELENLWG